MNWGKCLRCGEYKLNPHRCGCQMYLCWYEDTQNDPAEAREIYAQDKEDAAEKMGMAWYHDGESPSDMTILVQSPDGNRSLIRIEPQIELTWRTYEIEQSEIAE